MLILTEKTSQDLFNKNLSNLLGADNFDGFCNLIDIKKQFKTSFEIPVSVPPEKALKYVEFMLYKQKQHYVILITLRLTITQRISSIFLIV